jgi:flagellin
VEGIQLRYTGEQAPEGGFAGTVTFAQNSLIFHVGANAGQTSAVSLRSMQADKLGIGVANDSEFASFSTIDVTTAPGAEDAIRVIDKAIEDVAVQRGELGAFQKNNLESNLNYLRIAHQEVMGSESVIRDADMAEEIMAFTRNQIMVESSTAMMAQANMLSQSVLQLLGG